MIVDFIKYRSICKYPYYIYIYIFKQLSVNHQAIINLQTQHGVNIHINLIYIHIYLSTNLSFYLDPLTITLVFYHCRCLIPCTMIKSLVGECRCFYLKNKGLNYPSKNDLAMGKRSNNLLQFWRKRKLWENFLKQWLNHH